MEPRIFKDNFYANYFNKPIYTIEEFFSEYYDGCCSNLRKSWNDFQGYDSNVLLFFNVKNHPFCYTKDLILFLNGNFGCICGNDCKKITFKGIKRKYYD